MGELLCNDCLDSGWVEDREGRSVCACISETEPYQQLQAEVNRLQAENRKLRSMCKAASAEINECWDAHCDDMGNGPVNLMARLEGKVPPDLYPAFDCAAPIIKDAERYRWLRRQHWNYGELVVVRNPRVNVKLGSDCPFEKRLDAAIDAAMEGE